MNETGWLLTQKSLAPVFEDQGVSAVQHTAPPPARAYEYQTSDLLQ